MCCDPSPENWAPAPGGGGAGRFGKRNGPAGRREAGAHFPHEAPIIMVSNALSQGGKDTDRRQAVRPTRASCSLAAATIFSGVKPNFFCSSLSGADAPKVCM